MFDTVPLYQPRRTFGDEQHSNYEDRWPDPLDSIRDASSPLVLAIEEGSEHADAQGLTYHLGRPVLHPLTLLNSHTYPAHVDQCFENRSESDEVTSAA